MPFEDAAGLGHRADVERVADPPDEGLAEGRAPARDLVEVGAGQGRVPRVELAADLGRAQQVDVGGQLVVQRAPQRLRGEARLEVEVRHLLEGVDARVGAPRTVAREVAPAGDALHGLVERALHRARVLLGLPAGVARADVLEVEAKTGHAVKTNAILAPQ